MPEAGSEFLDLEHLSQVAEAVPEEPIESEDYVEYTATPPGRYVSPSRVIKGLQRDDGHFTFHVILQGGIVDIDDPSRTYEKSDRFPLTDKRISTRPYQHFDRGTTSGAARYLAAFGVSTKGVKVSAVPGLMLETQTQPVGVRIGRAPKAQQDAGQWVLPYHDGNGNEVVAPTNARPEGFKEFRTGDFLDETGKYRNVLEAAGRVWQTKAIVDGYFKLRD